MSLFGAAFTYAIGKVFIQHYASGGTMLDFGTEKARTFVGEQYEKGKQFVKRSKPVPPTAPALPSA